MRSSLVALFASVVWLSSGCQGSGPGGGDASPGDLARAGDADRPGDAGAVVDLAAPADLEPEVDLAAAPDLAMPDLAVVRDLAGAKFPGVLGGGPWLLGWSGGLDHFTWVRFDFDQATGGPLQLLEPMGMVGWIGFWPGCSGTGRWAITQKPDTVQLTLPNGCNLADVVLTFDAIGPPGMGWLKGVVAEARVTLVAPEPQPLQGYQFAPAVCDGKFQTCKLP